jgi:hypothetical protein
MIYRTAQKDIDEYYEKTSLNQSSIKVIISRGIPAYLEASSTLTGQKEDAGDKYFEEQDYFIVGSAVDCYLTMGEACYLNTYHFTNMPKPTPGVMSIIKRVFDVVRANNGLSIFSKLPDLSEFRMEIYGACEADAYYMNRRKDISDWENDTRIASILKEKNSNEYFKALIEAGDKIILSENQNQIINRVIGTLTTHPYTSWVFKDSSTVDIVYQFPIYFDVDGIFCKALLDMIRVDHTTKTIMPFDIKTIGDYITKFNTAVRVRRYDLQGSFYAYALSTALKQLSDLIGKDITAYRIANFAFIVESTKTPGTPLIFPLDSGLIACGRYGRDTDREQIFGWEDGMSKFKLWSEESFIMDNVIDKLTSHIKPGVVFINNDFNYNIKF